MLKSLFRRSSLASVVLAMGLVATPTARAQDPANNGTQMLATKHFLFVVHDGVLHQYDVRTLKLRKKVLLSTKEGLLQLEAAAAKAQAKARAEQKKALAEEVKRAAEIRKTLKPKSPAETSKVVERALMWLVTHQDKDGKWDCDGFMRHDDSGSEICDGPGNAVHDVGVTGLAIMALATAGDDYKKQIRRAVSWLHKMQHNDGLFGTNASHDFIYDHAVATLAICRACQVLDRQDALMLPMAQKGIDYLESHRNPYSVWRYQPRDNDNDTSVTTWCLMAYAAGKDLGLKVNKNALMLGATYYDQVTDPKGRAGYTKVGEGSARKPGMHGQRFPIDKTECMTAAALYGRYALKQKPAKHPTMNASAQLLLRKPPIWDEKAGTNDEYYWLFGSLAMQRVGGDPWLEWSQHLTSMIAGKQHQKGNLAGSWDPVGAWGEDGGRVYSTAALALACHATLPASN